MQLCKDCLSEDPPPKTKRPVVAKSGGRCATHWRKEKARRKKKAHENYVAKTYSLEPGEYAALKVFQGGKCAICQRATGASKNLAVDHDHTCCSGPVSCGKCVRGLVCGPCNSLLAHARDSEQMLSRAINYLRFAPYRHMKMRRDLRG